MRKRFLLWTSRSRQSQPKQMHFTKMPAALSQGLTCLARGVARWFSVLRINTDSCPSPTPTAGAVFRLEEDACSALASLRSPPHSRPGQAQQPRWRDNTSRKEAQFPVRHVNNDARALTQHIKEQRSSALHRIRGAHADHKHVARILGSFCSSVLQISSASDLNYIHIATMIHSTAVVWAALQRALVSAPKQQQQHCHSVVQSCLSQLLHRGQPMLSKMDAQGAANILWAFAKCGLHPDAAEPGVAADLLHIVADNKEPASAQALGNSVWAVATMQGDKPLSSATKRLIVTLCCRFLVYIAEPNHRDSATPQAVANVLWGLAILQYAWHYSQLNKLCAYLVFCVNHPSAKANVQPQDISNALWALRQLRHVPLLEQVTVLLTHVSGKVMQPNTQDISNIVSAVAGFGMHSLKGVVWTLALRVVQDEHSTTQNLCNVVWGLAVLEVLTLEVFRTVVDRVRGQLGGGALRLDQGRQLYQALYQLHSSLDRDPTADRAWQAATASLKQCTGGSIGRKLKPYNVDVNNVLEELGLRYSRDELLRNAGYTAAVLHPVAKASRPVMLTVTAQTEYATNNPTRLLGSAAFRRRVLGRHAELVCIPCVELNKEYVKATLEKITGLPIHAAFATSAASGPGR